MATINYSIIIPHKNIPDLLQRCLDSIPVRDDVQVIVVDDNSDPEKVDFDNFPGVGRPNTEVYFTKEGKGAGYARNFGITKAIGKWILFVDADDYLNYCSNQIFEDYKLAEYDAVFFNASSTFCDSYVNCWRANILNSHHGMDDNDPQKEFYFRYKFGEPWCKLVNREFIIDNGIRCEETIIHNDTQLSYLIGCYAKSIHYDKRAIYCVTRSSFSVSRQKSDECYYTRLRVFAKKFIFLKGKGIDLFEDDFIVPVFLHFEENKDPDGLQTCYRILDEYGLERNLIKKRIACFCSKKKKILFRSRVRGIFARAFDKLFS